MLVMSTVRQRGQDGTLRNSASRWLLVQEYITMHGTLNVKAQILSTSHL